MMETDRPPCAEAIHRRYRLPYVNEPTMNQSSERIVVFVTPAQKRALATKALSLGISVSELVRRAVLAFDETAGDVRAARIVDSWLASAPPDALDETLRRIADAAPSTAAPLSHALVPGEPQPEAPAMPAISETSESEREDEPAASPAPIPLAAAVAQALASAPVEAAGTQDGKPSPALDLETATRVTSHWSRTAGDAAGSEPAPGPVRKRFTPRPA